MQTIALISQKGGAGKTTLTVHLAAASAAAGHATGIIDLDPQASSANWGDRREAVQPVVVSAHATRLPQEMQNARDGGVERLFLDTAPHSDSVALSAARAADLVIVPCKPNILDIEAIGNTIGLMKAAGTPLFVVLNGVAPAGGEADEAEAAIKEAFGVPVCPARLTTRVAFARSLVAGQTAGEFVPAGKLAVDDKATGEVDRLHAFMCSHLNTQAPEPVQGRAGSDVQAEAAGGSYVAA
ncbi:MAG: ParA family protein [Bacteroidota bacterium]